MKVGISKLQLQGHSNYVRALVQLNDGRLASGSQDNSIRLWDIQKGLCVATLQEHSGSVFALTQLKDGRLVSGSGDKNIKLWDVKTGTCVTTMQGHSSSINSLTQLNDGRLASGCGDGNINLWDIKTGTCVATLQGHSSVVYVLTQLSGGRLASGSQDNNIKLWDVKTCTCVATLEGHSKSVFTLTQLNDGRLASGSGYPENSIKIWDTGDRILQLQVATKINAEAEENKKTSEETKEKIATTAISIAANDQKFTSIITRLDLSRAIQSKPQAIILGPDAEEEVIRQFFNGSNNFAGLVQLKIDIDMFSLIYSNQLIPLVKKGLKSLAIKAIFDIDINVFLDNLYFYSSLEELKLEPKDDKRNYSRYLKLDNDKLKQKCDGILKLNKDIKSFIEIELPKRAKEIKELGIPINDQKANLNSNQNEYLVNLGQLYTQYIDYGKLHNDFHEQADFKVLYDLARYWSLQEIIRRDDIDKLTLVKKIKPDINLNNCIETLQGDFRRPIDLAVENKSLRVVKWLIEQLIDATRKYDKVDIPTNNVSLIESNIRRNLPDFPFIVAFNETSELKNAFLNNEHALCDALAWCLYKNAIYDFGQICKEAEIDFYKPIQAGSFKGFALIQLILFYKRTDLFLNLLEDAAEEKLFNLANSCFPVLTNEGKFFYRGWSVLAVTLHLGLQNELSLLLPSKIAIQKTTIRHTLQEEKASVNDIKNSDSIPHKKQTDLIKLLLNGAAKYTHNNLETLKSYSRCLKYLIDNKIIEPEHIKNVSIYDDSNKSFLPLLHFAILNDIYIIIKDYADLLKDKLLNKVWVESVKEDVNPLQLAVMYRSMLHNSDFKDLYEAYQKNNCSNIINNPLPKYEGINLFQYAMLRYDRDYFLELAIQDENCPINVPFPLKHENYPGWLPIHVAILKTFLYGSWIKLFLKTENKDIVVNAKSEGGSKPDIVPSATATTEKVNVLVPFPTEGIPHNLAGLYPLSAIFYNGNPRKNSELVPRILSSYCEDLLPLVINSAVTMELKSEIIMQALEAAVRYHNIRSNRDHSKQITLLVNSGMINYSLLLLEFWENVERKGLNLFISVDKYIDNLLANMNHSIKPYRGDRQQAIYALTRIKVPLIKIDVVIKKLIEVLLNDEARDVRAAAAIVLTHIDRDGKDIVIDALLKAMSFLNNIPKQNAKNINDYPDAKSIDALVYFGQKNNANPKIVSGLIEKLKPICHQPDRFNAAYALGQIGNQTDAIINALLTGLDDMSYAVRVNCVEALRKLSTTKPDVLSKLAYLAKSDSTKTAREAAQSAIEQLDGKTSNLKDFKYIPSHDSIKFSATVKQCVLPDIKEAQLEIDVPADGTCLLYSVVFSMLLPALNDKNNFAEKFNLLFGNNNMAADAAESLRTLLQRYNGSPNFILDNASQLEVLVDVHFRQNVVSFMRSHKTDFSSFISENADAYLSRMVKAKTWGDVPEIAAMSRLLQRRIKVYREDAGVLTQTADHGQQQAETIYLIYTGVAKGKAASNTHYHFAISPQYMKHVVTPMANADTKNNAPSANSTPSAAVALAAHSAIFSAASLDTKNTQPTDSKIVNEVDAKKDNTKGKSETAAAAVAPPDLSSAQSRQNLGHLMK